MTKTFAALAAVLAVLVSAAPHRFLLSSRSNSNSLISFVAEGGQDHAAGSNQGSDGLGQCSLTVISEEKSVSSCSERHCDLVLDSL